MLHEMLAIGIPGPVCLPGRHRLGIVYKMDMIGKVGGKNLPSTMAYAHSHVFQYPLKVILGTMEGDVCTCVMLGLQW